MAGPSEDLPNDISFDDAQDHYRNGSGVTIMNRPGFAGE